MTDFATSHAGIELDVIDFSKLNKHSPFQDNTRQYSDKINYKEFVKDILKKILKNDSFLSFAVQISDVNKILKMKYSSAKDIADVILKDVGLTTKLLKLVNSSFYGQFSNKGIATISEAMIILGTKEIKLAAASLKVYEFIQDIANIKILKEKALTSLQRSIIARQIAIDEGIPDAEAIQISGMLYDFGEYLVALFSPEVFIRIEILVDEENISKEQASKSIIGVSYSELGRFVASKWNLPETIINAMKPVKKHDTLKTRLTVEDLQKHICAFSNELCHIEFSNNGHSAGQKIIEISEKYSACLDIPASKSVGYLKMSLDKITEHASILNVDVKENPYFPI